MTATRSTVNNGHQIGLESAYGSAHAADRYLPIAMMDPTTDAFDAKTYHGQGHKASIATRHNKDYLTSKFSGDASYNELVYFLTMLLGTQSASTPSGGVNIRQRTWDLPLGGPNTPVSATGQFGDSTNAEQFAYLLLTGATIKGTRDGVTVEFPFFAQQSTKGVTMTSSPTKIAPTPIIGASWSIYRDPTWALAATTLLPRATEWELAVTGLYEPYWVGNRVTNGKTYGLHKELKPTMTFKVTVEADATGDGVIADFRNDAMEFYSVIMLGNTADNYQVVTVTGSPSGGTFTLTYKGATTGTIAYNASAATVATALQALSTIGVSGCSVAGSDGGPWTVTMLGWLANDASALTLANNSLSGGSTPSVTIANTLKSNAFQITVAAGNGGDAPIKDGNSVLMTDYTYEILEDTVSGHAGQLYVASLIGSSL